VGSTAGTDVLENRKNILPHPGFETRIARPMAYTTLAPRPTSARKGFYPFTNTVRSQTGRSAYENDVPVAAAKHKQSANCLTTAAELQRVWAAARVACHTDKRTDRKRHPTVVR
jgi:hypothetical protein